MTNKHKGSSFDTFLESEALLDQVEAAAVKRIIALEIERSMKQGNISKKQMAETMRTSRAALDRLLDPTNTSVTLQSLVKVAHALGKRLQISFSRG